MSVMHSLPAHENTRLRYRDQLLVTIEGLNHSLL
jgi:hypothetical protein